MHSPSNKIHRTKQGDVERMTRCEEEREQMYTENEKEIRDQQTGRQSE